MTKALIFDSFFDKHRGVVAFVRLFAGSLRAGDEAYFLATGLRSTVQEVGYFSPDLTKSAAIEPGEVGYVIVGTKDLSLISVGDTISDTPDKANALPGYTQVQPKVYSSLFPVDQGDYPKLKDAIAKLKLSDSSLFYEVENIPALGYGFRCGFLGLLHMDIVQERLSREFDLDLIITTPSVEYKVVGHDGVEFSMKNPSELPDPSQIKEMKEPWVKIEIITPEKCVGSIIQLIADNRGMYTGITEISLGQMQITGELPLAEIIVDFYDDLKSVTKGYATVSYDPIGFRVEDLVKIDFLVNREPVPPLAVMAHRSQAEAKGRHICAKLKELIPRQQFDIAIQAAIGARIIARESIKPFRKDVTEGMYGGDMSRRKKLLEKQKKGKKKMKMIGNVEIPQTAFLNVLKK
jgi:GTP-binding protein LepA